MNKDKIIWTTISVAMTGALAYTLFCDYGEDSLVYKMAGSHGFAFTTGLVVAGTYLAFYR